MPIQWVVFWTDAAFFVVLFTIIGMAVIRLRNDKPSAWRYVWRNPVGMSACFVMCVYIVIALLDSLHYRTKLPQWGESTTAHYSTEVYSVLDKILSPLNTQMEKTYSAPFATHSFVKETVVNATGEVSEAYLPLTYGGHLLSPNESKSHNIIQLGGQGIFYGAIVSLALFLMIIYMAAGFKLNRILTLTKQVLLTKSGDVQWRALLITGVVIIITFSTLWMLSRGYHVLGTDKVGQDVFYQSLKSIRTGVMIGTLTTLIMLPFAILFGTLAGYFRGVTDDIIQYVYTTLSSIPGVLLIAASVLMLEVFITRHPDFFSGSDSQADARLFALCMILGITSWTSLCRLLRAETLKLRELDFVQAARVMGVGHFSIMFRHLVPNLMHIVLITVVLDFSGLVLAEAVLSYVGVGVDPTTFSWGNMINRARLELAREPAVSWSLMAAFIFMFALVLSANLFSDVVRDAFDPRVRQQKISES